MDISVLIVEDDLEKAGRLLKVLEDGGISGDKMSHQVSVSHAVAALKESKFDLMLLDVNLPRRLGEGPKRGGGIEILDQLDRDEMLHRPRYIVGVTAFADVIEEFGEKFSDRLWTLVHYSDNSDHWMSQIKSKAEYVQAVRKSDNFTDGITYGLDLAIICALDLELSAVLNLPCEWQPLRVPFDQTRYFTGSIAVSDKTFSVVAASAPRMGMPASAVIASKMVGTFRPRFLAMAGICAGRFEKINIGDVIVADPSWDWGSGKIDAVDDKPRFRPSPHHVELDGDLSAQLREIFEDVGLLASIKQRARGRHPDTELKVRVAPLASGAAVVADAPTFEKLLDQHRDLLGIEMEGYGIAMACKGAGRPRPISVIMKSVCDFADKNKVDDFHQYAAETSAIALYEAAKRFL